eukprot:1136874-Pelagomonas_calceolata.AAC.3
MAGGAGGCTFGGQETAGAQLSACSHQGHQDCAHTSAACCGVGDASLYAPFSPPAWLVHGVDSLDELEVVHIS